MEHYPTKQEVAQTALMDEFVKLVTYQEEKPRFSDDMVALSADNTLPVYFSSQQVAAIAEMLRDMSADNPKRWNQQACAAVYELAAKAEQHESDNPEHLMHTIMGIYECVAQAGGCYGALNGRYDKEREALAIKLCYEYDGGAKCVLPCLARMPYTPQGTANTMFYAITEVILRYTDSDCTLSFKAHPADEQMTTLPADDQHLFERKVWPGETELPASAVWPDIQKEIADYILSAMHENPGDASPLRKLGDGKWIAKDCDLAEVDGIYVPTAINQFSSCNILRVEVGTTGYMGGDTSYGGRTILRITNSANTDLRCSTGQRHYRMDVTDHGNVDQIEITLGGDAELDTFAKVLRFAADVLEKKIDGKLILNLPK